MLLLPGLKVVEVTHNFQKQVKNYITKDLELITSYDTRHGTCKYMYYVVYMYGKYMYPAIKTVF